jgi:hypothetical protein
VKKSECEPAIRALAHDWFNGLPDPKPEHPSFYAFKTWLHENGYGHYLDFKSTEGPDEAAEYWFDQELKQTWRR